MSGDRRVDTMIPAPRAPARRRFLIASGAAGVLVGVAGLAGCGRGGSAAGPHPHPWIAIGTDGTVTVSCGFAEMGQGVFTGIATLVAEELGCAWSQLRVVTGPVAAHHINDAVARDLMLPNHGLAKRAEEMGFADRAATWVAGVAGQQITGGSSSIVEKWTSAREGGAMLRTMLVAAAAAKWSVDPASCTVREGSVVHAASARSLKFAELAPAIATATPPTSVTLKPRAQWTLIGDPKRPRVDVPEKVDGSAVYGIDVRRPGMLHAAMVHAPTMGGSLGRWDEASLQGQKVIGVHAVPGGVAVVADSSWRALKAARALKVTWVDGPNATLDAAAIDKRLVDALGGSLRNAHAHGDVSTVPPGGRTLEADYVLPYLSHATMEPQNCTAEVIGDAVTVWAPVQAHTLAVQAAAKAAGVAESKVTIHTTLLGGGFGRRLEIDYITQAVTLARAVGKPVQLLWSREEDLRHDFYRPAAVVRIKGTLDAKGAPHAVSHVVASQSILARVFPPATWAGPDLLMYEGLAELPYAIPNQRCDVATVELPVPVASWRSVGHSITAFAKESFIDEMAHAAKADPLAMRRGLLAAHPRLVALLDAVEQRSGWRTPLPAGQGRGVALHTTFLTACAQVVEVAVDAKGAIAVRRVVAAIDCGTAVNPDIVRQQVEGAIVQGLSAALHSKITLKDGRVEQQNFTDYPQMMLGATPEIEVIVIASDAPPGGVGEPGLPPVAPALANAVFAATGTRIRRLPMVDEGFSA